MKKEENQKRNVALKNEYFSRPRSHSPKAYLGCDTCKVRNAKSASKLSACGGVQDKCKLKKTPHSGKDEQGLTNQKIKLIDLCDEDKKRLVQLIEELSNFSEKNEELKERLSQVQKNEQEQQDYILKQANLFLEEKNFYLNEINEYKNRVEKLESEMRDKYSQWKNHGRSKDNAIQYLARALKKLLKEKNEMHEQMNHLKVTLKHSLESFQKLSAEVTKLQLEEQQTRKHKSVSCQTQSRGASKEKHKSFEEDTEEDEFMSTCNHDSVNAKSSLDIINNKLENVYQLLKKRRECIPNAFPQKCDTDLTILARDDRFAKEVRFEDVNCKNEGNNSTGTSNAADDSIRAGNDENLEELWKLFEEHNKSLEQDKRTLKIRGKPLDLHTSECAQTLENNNISTIKNKQSTRDGRNLNFLQNKVVQKNNFFKSSDSNQYDEDRLLEELFYSDQGTHLGLDTRPEAKTMKKNSTETRFPL